MADMANMVNDDGPAEDVRDCETDDPFILWWRGCSQAMLAPHESKSFESQGRDCVKAAEKLLALAKELAGE